MSWKKTFFSYFLWFLLFLMTCISLALLLRDGLKVLWPSLESVFPPAPVAGILGLLIVLLIGQLSFSIPKFPMTSLFLAKKHTVRDVAEAALVAVLLAVDLVLRIEGMNGDMQEMAGYFEAAFVSEDHFVPQIAHGATYLYVQLLHGLFFLLGNKMEVAIALQIGLQLMTVFFLYVGMRNLFGHIAALVPTCFMLLAPSFVASANVLSPENLYLFLCAIIFLIVSLCIGQSEKKKCSPILLAIFGILASALLYLDVFGVVFLIFLLSIPFWEKWTESNGTNRCVSSVCAFLGCVGGFCLWILLDALASGKKFSGVMKAWMVLYAPEKFDINFLKAESFSLEVEGFVLILFVCLGLFGFWIDKKRDSIGLLTLITIVVLGMGAFGIFTDEITGKTAITICLVLLAGICPQSCFVLLESEPQDELVVEDLMSGEPSREDLKKSENKHASDEVLSDTEPEDDSFVLAQDKKEGVVFLENPLPLPKKHARKVLDFDLQGAEEDDYDLAVSDDDDFDI